MSVIYATETGTARTFAMRVKSHFEAHFNVESYGALQFEEAMAKSTTCLFIVSTFGSGDPPQMGQNMTGWLNDELTKKEQFQDKLVEDIETAFAKPRKRSVSQLLMKKDPYYKSVLTNLRYHARTVTYPNNSLYKTLF